jgi:hypothetical protein
VKLKMIQIGAVGGEIWRIGSEKWGSTWKVKFTPRALRHVCRNWQFSSSVVHSLWVLSLKPPVPAHILWSHS